MDRNESGIADPPDVGSVFAMHRVGLVRLALLLVGDRATAEEVVQDAFVGPHSRWAELHDSGSALAYARGSVVNGCRMVPRRRSLMRRVGIAPDPPVWPAESAAVVREDHWEVIEALQRLPLRRREVLVLRYHLDLSDAEIAPIVVAGVLVGRERTSAPGPLSGGSPRYFLADVRGVNGVGELTVRDVETGRVTATRKPPSGGAWARVSATADRTRACSTSSPRRPTRTLRTPSTGCGSTTPAGSAG